MPLARKTTVRGGRLYRRITSAILNSMKNRNRVLIYSLSITIGLGVAGCSREVPPPASKAPVSATSALDAATEAVRKSPTFDTYLQLGLAQLGAHHAEEAMKSFEKCVGLNPKSAVGYNDLCAAANEMKHWNAAIDACKSALSISPDMQLAQNNLRFAKDSQKKTADVIANLEAKSHTPSPDGGPLMELGMQYYTIGEYDKAISVWKKIPPDIKSWANAQNDIASAAILKKDFGLAKSALEKALTADPRNPLFLNNRNWLTRVEKEAGGG